MSERTVPRFAGNINFNAQHSPAGAFMSFTCGHFGTGGGIGIEIGRPAAHDLFVGVKRGGRRAPGPIRCLPFVKRAQYPGAVHYDVEHAKPAPAVEVYADEDVARHYGWATDSWTTDDLTFSICTPFGTIPDPGGGGATDAALRDALLPAVIATLRVDNRDGTETKTAVFAIDFVEPGARVLRAARAAADDAGATSSVDRLGFAWRRSMGVMGVLEDAEPGEQLHALQRWSVVEGLADRNPVHELGTCAGLAFEVPPGEQRTLVLAIGVYLDGVVTTGLEGRYYYARCYESLTDVLHAALDRATTLRAQAARLDATLLGSGLSPDQQFLIAHATRSYYA